MSSDPRMRGSQGESLAWASGIALFAGILLATAGTFQFLQGLSAVLKDDVFVRGIDYTYKIDLTGWGWFHMVVGVVIVAVGVGVVARQQWARVVGMGVAILQALMQFTFLPYYPLWSMLLIAMDILIVWALAQEWSQDA